MQPDLIYHLTTTYPYLLYGTTIAYLVAGLFSIFQRDFREMVSAPYLLSRRMMGALFLLFSFDTCFSFCFFIGKMPRDLSVAMSVIFFQMKFILYGYIFLVLLDRSYITPHRIKIDGIWLAITTTLVITSLLIEPPYAPHLLWTATASLLFYMIFIAGKYIYYDSHFRRHMNDFLNDNVRWLILWLRNSSILLCIYALASIGTLYTSTLWQAILVLYELGINIYIFIKFHGFRIKYKGIETAIREYNTRSIRNRIYPEKIDTDIEDTGISNEAIRRLNLWIMRKGYCKPGITIQGLAREIGTNRLYLSQHINKKESCSFSEWICRMRIEEAKKRLKQSVETTVEEIAISLGFSSGSYFTKNFIRYVGKSPGRYRQESDDMFLPSSPDKPTLPPEL